MARGSPGPAAPDPARTLTRRGALRAAAATGAGLLTAGATGCAGGSTSTGPVQLEFWSWIPGIEESVALWNAQHPDIQVRFVRIAAGKEGGYAKLYAATEAGRAPDVAQIEFTELPAMMLNNALTNLSELGAQRHTGQFVDWTVEQSTFNGSLYALPQGTGPLVLYYRKDKFDEWGIEPPRTWQEYTEAAERVRRRGAYITTLSTNNSAQFLAYSWQGGAIWFSADDHDWLINLDSEPSRRVATYWQHMIERDLVETMPISGSAYFKALQDGKLVTLVGAAWHAGMLSGNVANTAGKWAVAPVPQWWDDPRNPGAQPFRSANIGGSTMALMNGGKHPHEALRFALWLCTSPAAGNISVDGGNGPPTLKDTSEVTSLKAPQDFFDGQVLGGLFDQAKSAVDTTWRWNPATNQATEHLNVALHEAVREGTSFAEMLGGVQRNIIRDLDKKGLPYRVL